MKFRDSVVRQFEVNLGQVRSARRSLPNIERAILSLSLSVLCSSSRSPLILTAYITGLGEHGYKSPSLEVWVSVNIMGGGGVLIAAR